MGSKKEKPQAAAADGIDLEYTWTEGDENAPPKELPKKEAEPKELEFDRILRLQNEVREAKKKIREDLPEHLDITVIWMQGIKEPRPYIIRSMDLKDSEDLEKEVDERCEMFIDGLKSEAQKKGMDPSKIFLTVGDRDRIMTHTMVKKFTVYPPNISDIIDQQKIKPGDFAELYKGISALSGYFPPQFESEEDEIQLQEGELKRETFRGDSEVE